MCLLMKLGTGQVSPEPELNYLKPVPTWTWVNHFWYTWSLTLRWGQVCLHKITWHDLNFPDWFRALIIKLNPDLDNQLVSYSFQLKILISTHARLIITKNIEFHYQFYAKLMWKVNLGNKFIILHSNVRHYRQLEIQNISMETMNSNRDSIWLKFNSLVSTWNGCVCDKPISFINENSYQIC